MRATAKRGVSLFSNSTGKEKHEKSKAGQGRGECRKDRDGWGVLETKHVSMLQNSRKAETTLRMGRGAERQKLGDPLLTCTVHGALKIYWIWRCETSTRQVPDCLLFLSPPFLLHVPHSFLLLSFSFSSPHLSTAMAPSGTRVDIEDESTVQHHGQRRQHLAPWASHGLSVYLKTALAVLMILVVVTFWYEHR